MSEKIEIELWIYKSLLRDRDKLRALENAGVDNWEGYDEAMSSAKDIYFELLDNFNKMTSLDPDDE